MKKNIILKMLTGVITTGLTVAGIVVPTATTFNQNTADVFVTADEEQIAETAYAEGPEYNYDQLQAPTVTENIISDEQTAVIAESKIQTVVKEQTVSDEKGSNTVNTAGIAATANTDKAGSNKTDTAAVTSTTDNIDKTANTDTTVNTTKTTSDKTVAAVDTDTSSDTDTVVAAPSKIATTQTEAPVKTEAPAKTETPVKTEDPVKTEEVVVAEAEEVEPEEENRVVTSNVAIAEITITIPGRKPEGNGEEQAEEVVEEQPVYIEIHNCNCGWTTSDYDELKMHMYNHVIKGEAYSYSTHVVKQ